MHLLLILPVVFITMLVAFPQVAIAYIGPGAGIAAIGTVLALFGGIFLAILAFIWYPIKRLLAKIKKQKMTGKENL
jgi:membrane protein implicated in regulation of membrane protease activity